MCGGGGGKTPAPTPEAQPANLQLEDSARRRRRAKGASAEGVGRKSLRVDLNFAPGSLAGLSLPVAGGGVTTPAAAP